ncbi:hypothetical protein FDI61_gp007 [Mycobacterium phage Marvin]|uniref:Uncharacterized protein n=1 Tax=Mycobacterium phage Marvin TaxID=1034139 RepID=G1BN77_9CAUD|nr:hypothetical protein FDI61_gp007 [Mycobacterium phage Marvin]AEJ95389.1 hypothetical protein MARVIN_7 [Mycobacterium phage Marvin]
MNAPELRAVLTEAQALHRWRGDFLGCGCGWNWPEERTYFCGEDERIAKAHAAHVVDALLSLPGVAVIQLPDEMTDRTNVAEKSDANRCGSTKARGRRSKVTTVTRAEAIAAYAATSCATCQHPSSHHSDIGTCEACSCESFEEEA